MAQIVITAAQVQAQDIDAGFGAELLGWDGASKLARINPGTTADLTVAALLMAGLTGGF